MFPKSELSTEIKAFAYRVKNIKSEKDQQEIVMIYVRKMRELCICQNLIQRLTESLSIVSKLLNQKNKTKVLSLKQSFDDEGDYPDW